MKIDKLIFTILRYLYECSDLAAPSMEPISPEVLRVPVEQWYNAIAMLHEEGYVRGAIIKESKTGRYVLNEECMRITMKGIEYCKENAGFKKFLEAARGVREVLP